MSTRVKCNLIFSLLLAFLALGAFVTGYAEDAEKGKTNRFPADWHKTFPKANLESSDIGPGDQNAEFGEPPKNLGFDQRGTVVPGPGVGVTMGLTTYDEQHLSRCTRQVAWRGTNNIHFAWMKKRNYDPVVGAGVRVTSYNMWDATPGLLKWLAVDAYFGGDDLHPSTERSGYCGIDVMSDGRGLPYNHCDPDGLSPFVYYPTIFPDFAPGAGMWGYKQAVPVEHRQSGFCNFETYKWPYLSFQLYDNGSVEDTIMHILAKEPACYGYDATELRYFRRSGAGPHPEAPGLTWEHMVVDTTHVVGYVVEAAPPEATGYEGKVALTWIAHWPDMTGDGESSTLEPYHFLVEQNCNDIYSMVSDDGGQSWSSKYNITKMDSLIGGWVPLGDVSTVIDTDGRLHVVYAARQFINTNNGQPQSPQNMEWPQFPLASRIYHWSDEGEMWDSGLDDNYITVVRDGAWDWSDYDEICFGGEWNRMSLTKPMISQCDDKLYVLFAQYQDPDNGVIDNCHINNWNNNDYLGSANAVLYFTVSPMSNGGLNWDPARMLTDFTPICDTAETGNPEIPVDPMASSVCHSHGWPSMSRWGWILVAAVTSPMPLLLMMLHGLLHRLISIWMYSTKTITGPAVLFRVKAHGR